MTTPTELSEAHLQDHELISAALEASSLSPNTSSAVLPPFKTAAPQGLHVNNEDSRSSPEAPLSPSAQSPDLLTTPRTDASRTLSSPPNPLLPSTPSTLDTRNSVKFTLLMKEPAQGTAGETQKANERERVTFARDEDDPPSQGESAEPEDGTEELALDPVLFAALNHHRDRFLLLRAEVELERFLANPAMTRLPLAPPYFQPALNSYQRLLVHRLADTFGITREVVTTPAQKFRAALASPTASISLLDRLHFKVQATQPNNDPLDSLRNTDPSTRQTSLHIAANAGRADVVEWLLEQGVEKEISRDAAGETVLHVAAAKGFVEILAIYLDPFGFVIDWANSRGMTPLHTAAMRGELEAAQILIVNGAEVNAPDLHGNTPLHYALSWGKLPVVKLLVDYDCETDLKNNQGFSASDFAYSFSAADALKVYVRLHHDARKSARASKSRRPRNPRIDSGASSTSRSGRKAPSVGSSSELPVFPGPASPPAEELTSPPLQPIASPQSQSAASPSLSEGSSAFPGRYGLGVRLRNSLRRDRSDAGGGRESPLPAPIAVRPGPISPSLISLQPATPTTPQTPQSPGYSQYNTTSPARSPLQGPSSSPQRAESNPVPANSSPRPQSHSPLSMQSRRSRSSSTNSPQTLAKSSSSYFPPPPGVQVDPATGSAAASSSSIPTPSGSPSSSRPSPVPLNLPRSSSSSPDLVPTNGNGPKKLRKKGGRRDSIVQQQQEQQQQRPVSVGGGRVPVVLGGGPGGKKLRSERSMSFGTAMTSTGEVPTLRPQDLTKQNGGVGSRSRSSTNQSLASYSSNSTNEMPPPPVPTVHARLATPPTTAIDEDDDYSDMIKSSPPLGRPILTPPSPPQTHPVAGGGSRLSLPLPASPIPHVSPSPTLRPPEIPPPDSAASLTTRSNEPSFIVVSGSSTKTSSPIPPSQSTFSSPAPPLSAPARSNSPPHDPRLSLASSQSRSSSIALGKPPSHEVAKLRKTSKEAKNKMRERSVSEASKGTTNGGGGGGGGRFARALGFGRKAT